MFGHSHSIEILFKSLVKKFLVEAAVTHRTYSVPDYFCLLQTCSFWNRTFFKEYQFKEVPVFYLLHPISRIQIFKNKKEQASKTNKFYMTWIYFEYRFHRPKSRAIVVKEGHLHHEWIYLIDPVKKISVFLPKMDPSGKLKWSTKSDTTAMNNRCKCKLSEVFDQPQPLQQQITIDN